MTRLDVYSDFRAFFDRNKYGVYAPHTPGILEERHAVVLVGYDNNEETFTALNSWGTGFAAGGFFKVLVVDRGRGEPTWMHKRLLGT